MHPNTPELSVVIPVYNEEHCLQELFSRLESTLEAMGKRYEMIAVDDGSTDSSLALLRDIRRANPRVRVIRLSRNFGQSPAVYAGFSLAQGRYVVMIDADLQVYPEDIPLIYDKLEAGCDMVSGWRADRHDTLFRKAASRLLNVYIARVTRFPLHDHGCSLKGFRREMTDHMVAFSHRNRYLPVDAAMLGGRVGEVRVRHERRHHGKSKYSLFKLIRTGFDLITTITNMPLQFVGIAGGLCVVTGMVTGVGAAVAFWGSGTLSWPVLLLAMFAFFTGVQLLALGLMGEYVGRIYIETQRKPYFIIQEELE